MAIETDDAVHAPRSAPSDVDEPRPPGTERLGLRARIPKLGLREYWYPVVLERKVGRRPIRRTVLGRSLVFFRGTGGKVAALDDRCPHRNASLALGKCFFDGTITCGYHGLTFDQTGKALAFLGEGPDSPLVGHPAANARAFPTMTLHGLVFVWMGEGAPAPIEEDVPPEFFDESALIQFAEDEWNANWRVSLENLNDAHVYFVHRNSLDVLSMDPKGLQLFLHAGPTRPKPTVVNGRALVFDNPRFFDAWDQQQDRKTPPKRDFQDDYPELGGKWPKTRWRLRIATVNGFVRRYLRPKKDWLITDPEWAALHMPSTFRVDMQTHIYSRAVTPIDESTSRIFYYNTTFPKSRVRRVYNRVVFRVYYDWKQHRNFSGQDQKVVENIDYENPHEKFAGSDVFPLTWRRFVIEYARQPTPVDVPVVVSAEDAFVE